jgi:hypothetical protein
MAPVGCSLNGWTARCTPDTTGYHAIASNPTHETYQALLAEAYKRSPHPIRLLGSGVRFVEEVEDYKESSQQLLILEHPSN